MVENDEKGYFENLELVQIIGQKAGLCDGVELEGLISNLHTMCNDKIHYRRLNTLNFNNNGYTESNNGLDIILRSVCIDTNVTIHTAQEAGFYPPMCSTTYENNFGYYDRSDEKEVIQCRFNWNWEMDNS